MEKIALQLFGITESSTQPQRYVLVLEEKKGLRRIPIQMGLQEAQGIAMGLEGIQTPRPLTHELMLNLLEKQQSVLKEVHISSFNSGIFEAQLIIKHTQGTYSLSARPSDAIALAVRQACEIFTSEEVLSRTGMLPDPSGQSDGLIGKTLADLSLPDLEALLERLLAEENYEQAQLVRKQIEARGGR